MIHTIFRGSIPTTVALAAMVAACHGAASFSELSGAAEGSSSHDEQVDEDQPRRAAHGAHRATSETAHEAAPEEPVDPSKAPRAVFASTEHDFGEVEQGAKVQHVFKVRNEGRGVLHIKKVRGS